MTIYVCEQDPTRAKLIKDVLGVYNYKVESVHNSYEFFKKANSKKPSVVVLNEFFADANGPDLLKRLRENPRTFNVPVIFIGNGQTSYQVNQNMFVDDLTEFVFEPLKIKNLRHYIDRWTTFKSLYTKN
ncbi:MAG: response regulator [Caldithrix sp.]|nr:response regulator [Caldithrix sp.]